MIIDNSEKEIDATALISDNKTHKNNKTTQYSMYQKYGPSRVCIDGKDHFRIFNIKH